MVDPSRVHDGFSSDSLPWVQIPRLAGLFTERPCRARFGPNCLCQSRPLQHTCRMGRPCGGVRAAFALRNRVRRILHALKPTARIATMPIALKGQPVNSPASRGTSAQGREAALNMKNPDPLKGSTNLSLAAIGCFLGRVQETLFSHDGFFPLLRKGSGGLFLARNRPPVPLQRTLD